MRRRDESGSRRSTRLSRSTHAQLSHHISDPKTTTIPGSSKRPSNISATSTAWRKLRQLLGSFMTRCWNSIRAGSILGGRSGVPHAQLSHERVADVSNSYWLSQNLPNAVLLTYPDSGQGVSRVLHAACVGIPRFRLSVCALLAGYRFLKRYLSIPNALIRESSVCRGIPSFLAAPDGPEVLPLDSFRAASINSLSRRDKSSANGTVGPVSFCGLVLNHASSTENISPSLKMTARSTTFCSSRMLPGQS